MGFIGTPGHSLAVSPDGEAVVYRGRTPEELLVRSLANRTVRALPGTEGARQPFFSPDGRRVAFFTYFGELKTVALDGGNPLTLAENIDASSWAFGTWTTDDQIVFGRLSGGLQQVSAQGGPLAPLTAPEGARGERHMHPHLLPGTRHVLFTVIDDEASGPRIDALNLDTRERRVVIETGSQPSFLTSGHLLYQRDGDLVAVGFDAHRLAPTGPVLSITDEIRTDGPNPGREGSILQMAVSQTGTLAYVPPPSDAEARLGIVSADGGFEAFGPALANTTRPNPRVSPDGRTVAFADGGREDGQVYLHDLARGATDRLTQDGSWQSPAWQPAGGALAVAKRGSGSGIYLKSASGLEQLIVQARETEIARNASWSPDGAVLAYTVQDGNAHDIWVVSADDPSSARPLIEGPAREYSPRFSPDGRWLAYVSDESGRSEVYLRRYPEGERLRASTEGGFGAVWTPDQAALVLAGLHEGDVKLLSVSLAPEGETLRLGVPTPLFETRLRGGDGAYYRYIPGGNGGVGFDVLPDGRFAMVRVREMPALEIVLVQNVGEELRRLAPGN